MTTRARAAATALRRGVLVLVAGLALVQVVLSWVPQRASLAPTTERLEVERLLRQGGCWTEATAPRGEVMPGSALVTLPGGEPRLVGVDVGFGIWLEGRPGVLHAFCPGAPGAGR